MKSISKTPRTFLRALQRRLPVICTDDGLWKCESTLQRFWRKTTCNSNGRLLSLADGFIKALDELELTPILFGLKRHNSILLHVKATKTILMQMEDSHLQNHRLFKELSRRFIALLYRLEDYNGGFSRAAPDPNDTAKLRELALEWKKQDPLIPNKELTDSELATICETATYPLFVELLFQDKELQDLYFRWTLKDKNLSGPFIQFPAMQKKITESDMAGRIGRVDPSMLKIQRVKAATGFEKNLTLPFEGTDVSILDPEKEFTFENEYKLQVREVFEIFENKFAGAGNLELLAKGITNWNYLKCAKWNGRTKSYQAINVHRKDWWKELPILETLSLGDAKERYGDHIDGIHWNVAAAASRGSATLDYEQTHAYLNVAIPNGDGSYNIYDFGKLANVFPTTFLEKISMFAFNVHASVAYPDESIYYSQREHTYYSVPMNETTAAAVMESIRQDMIVSRENHFLYQIESDNCARWAQHKIEAGIGEDVLPNLFQMHLLATEPTGFTRTLFDWIKKAPLSLRTFILTRLHIPLGATFGTWIVEQGRRVRKSLSSHEFYDTGLVYLPAYLHRQQEIGLLGRVVDCIDQFLSDVSCSLYNLTKCFSRENANPIPFEQQCSRFNPLVRHFQEYWRSDGGCILTG